jgi:hypothetical protein
MDATTPLITVYLLDDRMAGQRLASAAPSRFYPMARCWPPNASGVLGYRHRRGPIRALPSLARLVPASRPGPPDHLRASGGQLVGGQGPAASAAARAGWPIISALEVGPQRLNRVEVGRIGRHPLHHQPVPLGGQEGAHRVATVGAQSVPQHGGLLAAKDPAQLLEHPDQRGGVVAAGLDVEDNGAVAAVLAGADHDELVHAGLGAPHLAGPAEELAHVGR